MDPNKYIFPKVCTEQTWFVHCTYWADAGAAPGALLWMHRPCHETNDWVVWWVTAWDWGGMTKLMGQWVIKAFTAGRPNSLALFLSCNWVRMIVLIFSPSNFFLSICPCRLLVRKEHQPSAGQPGASRVPHHLQPNPSSVQGQWDAVQGQWDTVRGQWDAATCARVTFKQNSALLCFRCDPNCHFWRFCRLRAPRVKPSRWRRWVWFPGTEMVPVPVFWDVALSGEGLLLIFMDFEAFCAK